MTDKLELEPVQDSPLSIVEDSTNKAITGLVNAESQEEFDSLLSLFNLAQNKKKVVRILQYNNLLDAVTEEALSRYQKNPDEISNKELLDCINIVSTQLDKSEQSLKNVTVTPAIQVNNTKNDINISFPQQYTQDEKANVIDAVNKILALVKQGDIDSCKEESTIIDVTDTTIENNNEEINQYDPN